MTKPTLITPETWTLEEDARLRRLAAEGRGANVCAERLKRDVTVVRNRARKLQISLKVVRKTKGQPEAVCRPVELRLKPRK